MASSREYLDFVLEQLEGISGIDYKKMFGEYLIYINNKPAIMVCDNTPMVKKLPELLELLQGAPGVYPRGYATVFGAVPPSTAWPRCASLRYLPPTLRRWYSI